MDDLNINFDGTHDDELCDLVAALRKLVAYGDKAISARGHRKRGAIKVALMREREMQEIYDSLPAFARW